MGQPSPTVRRASRASATAFGAQREKDTTLGSFGGKGQLHFHVSQQATRTRRRPRHRADLASERMVPFRARGPRVCCLGHRAASSGLRHGQRWRPRFPSYLPPRGTGVERRPGRRVRPPRASRPAGRRDSLWTATLRSLPAFLPDGPSIGSPPR